MNDDERSQPITSRAREHLDRSADELDTVTRTRLQAVRLRALESLEAPRPLGRSRGLLVSSGVVGALGVLVGVALWMRGAEAPDALADGFEDVEILTATDDLELYDDLDFYRWLEDSEQI